MKLRVMTVLLLGMIAGACGTDDEPGATEDGVTVRPTGSSTLATFALDVPASVKRGEGRGFALNLQPAPGEAGGLSELLFDSGSVRVPPGRYCARIESTVSNSRLKTKDCSLVLVGGATTTYRVSTIAAQEDAMAFVRTQTTKFGSVGDLLLTGSHVEEGWLNSLRAMTFATAPGTFTTELRATGASWPKLETVVGPASDAVLAIPREDKVVRINLGAEGGQLGGAIPGGGLRWRWDGSPEDLVEYREWHTLPLNGVLSVWSHPQGSIRFELGGIERRVEVAQPTTTTMFARRIEVTDVTETDDSGAVQTIRGLVAVSPKGQGHRLAWYDMNGRKIDTFATQQSVFVWAGEYDVQVFYTANGVGKTYRESIRVP